MKPSTVCLLALALCGSGCKAFYDPPQLLYTGEKWERWNSYERPSSLLRSFEPKRGAVHESEYLWSGKYMPRLGEFPH